MAPPERDAVFDDHFGSRRSKSPETSSATPTAWGQCSIINPYTDIDDYYKAQADRLAQKDLRATPMASTSRDGAAWGEFLYRRHV